MRDAKPCFRTKRGANGDKDLLTVWVGKVTAEDVQRVARQWLVPERLAVAHVVPEQGEQE